jgi:hypothetical protein
MDSAAEFFAGNTKFRTTELAFRKSAAASASFQGLFSSLTILKWFFSTEFSFSTKHQIQVIGK